MRWLFLLLAVLNGVYYLWQQQAPLPVKHATSLSLSLSEGSVPDIRLLAESSSILLRRESAPVGPAVVVVKCLFVGGFEQERAAKVLGRRLLSLNIQAGVRVLSTPGATDYWVYLAPLASAQASFRQLKELQARKIASYIISQGDLANGISLGIFARANVAQDAMRRLRAAGYQPELRELARAQRTYWVRVAAHSRHLADAALLKRLAQEFVSLRHQLMPCKSIATTL
ncbi:MAG: SPOR domain-containing protein [Pseudomonas sp.]